MVPRRYFFTLLAQISLVYAWQLCVAQSNDSPFSAARYESDCTPFIESGNYNRYYNDTVWYCPTFDYQVAVQCTINTGCSLDFGCAMICGIIPYSFGTCHSEQGADVITFDQTSPEFYQFLMSSPLLLQLSDSMEWTDGQLLAIDLMPGQVATINTGTACSSHQKRQIGVAEVVLIIGVVWIIDFAAGSIILRRAQNLLQEGVDALRELNSELQTDQNRATVSMQLECDCALISTAKRSMHAEKADNLSVSVFHASTNITISFRVGSQLIGLYSMSSNGSAIDSFHSTMELDITSTNARSPAANPATPANLATPSTNSAPLINSASILYYYAKLIILAWYFIFN